MKTPNKTKDVEIKAAAKRRPDLPRQLQGLSEGFGQIVERLPIPLALIRRSDNVILYTNPALDELVGMAAAKTWNRDSDFLVPNLSDRRRLKNFLKQNGEVRGEEIESRRRDGTLLKLFVWQTTFACLDTECLLTALLDVTERRAADISQREQLASIQQVLKWNDREHQLIAYEIHDGFVQQMVTALMQLDAYRWGLEQGKPNAEEKLDAAVEALRQGTAEARRLIERVRPPDLETAGLIGALRTLTQRMSQSGDFSVDVRIDREFPTVAAEAETAIYRIVQECLTNVRRHSKSDRARVELRVDGQELRIAVQDWGTGFVVNSAVEGHYGLLGMRERARLLGGRTEIESSPGAGTRVTLVLPYQAKSSAPRDKGSKRRLHG